MSKFDLQMLDEFSIDSSTAYLHTDLLEFIKEHLTGQ